jgi:hypothetical protein
LLAILDGHALGEQLRGEPARDLRDLARAVRTPRPYKFDFLHSPTLHAVSGFFIVLQYSVAC